MRQNHVFDPKAFKKQRAPLLFLAMLPSFFIDGYLAFALVNHLHGFLFPQEVKNLWDAAAPFASNFLLFKAPAVFVYSRIRQQRLGSYIGSNDRLIVYRKSKMRIFAKLDHGYAYHDDCYINDINCIKRKKRGSIVVQGDVLVVRKQHGIEAIMRERKRKRLVIPAYYSDMDCLADTLMTLTNKKCEGVICR